MEYETNKKEGLQGKAEETQSGNNNQEQQKRKNKAQYEQLK